MLPVSSLTALKKMCPKSQTPIRFFLFNPVVNCTYSFYHIRLLFCFALFSFLVFLPFFFFFLLLVGLFLFLFFFRGGGGFCLFFCFCYFGFFFVLFSLKLMSLNQLNSKKNIYDTVHDPSILR